MRILITGITGFVGLHLARHLAASGHEVRGLVSDRLDPAPDLGYEVFRSDLLDLPALRRAVSSSEADVVVHLAGLSHVGASRERPGDYLRVNFVGTCHLLDAASGRRVVFASSSEVYGAVPEDDQPITEDRPLEPGSPYAMTKACAERLAIEREAVVARSFNALGSGQAPGFAMPSFAAQLAAIERRERPPMLRVGNLSARRDFVHVADVVEAYRLLIEAGEPGEVYNIARGEACSIRDLLDALLRIAGVEAEIVVDEGRLRAEDAPLMRGDAGKLRALGWSPWRSIDEALREIWQAARDEARKEA